MQLNFNAPYVKNYLEKKCNYNRHTKKSKLSFPGGYYKLSRTVFDLLEELNIHIADDLKHYPWYSVFDMEAILGQPSEETFSASSRKLKHEHKPIAVCLCSNVEGFTKEYFILEEDEDVLVSKMIDHLTSISDKCEQLSLGRWCSVFEELNSLENTWRKKQASSSSNDDNNDDDDDDEALESTKFEPPSEEFLQAMSKEKSISNFCSAWNKIMR